MIIFTLILIACLISIVWHTLRLGISPMPSSRKAQQAIGDLLPEVDGPVYELGSGWGNLLGVLERYSDVTAFELSPVPFAVAWLFAPKHVRVLRKDFFEEDLSKAKLVVCYLYPGAMARLKDKFDKELHDCWVISNTFAVPGWTPEQVVVLDDWYKTKVYLYKKR